MPSSPISQAWREDGGAALLEMLAQPDGAALIVADEARELCLALDQRQLGEIAPIEVQEIEDVIDEGLLLARP